VVAIDIRVELYITATTSVVIVWIWINSGPKNMGNFLGLAEWLLAFQGLYSMELLNIMAEYLTLQLHIR
jgi:hypothetical protein